MANDNKKINDLVSESDDDTSELEVLTATVVFNPNHDCEAESDAATHCFETLTRPAAEDESIAALKSDLQQREENISNLQYDIAELRARWTGLEKELKAREELTDNVTRELEQSNHKLAQSISLLKKRDSQIAALETALAQQASRLAQAETAIEEACSDAASLQAEMDAIQDRNKAALNTVSSLNAELTEERTKRKWAEESDQAQGERIEQLEKQRDESKSLVASLQQYIEGRKSSWGRQEAALSSNARALKEQRRENSRLAREARVTAENLRKARAARQRLLTERSTLQAALAQSRAESAAIAEALAAAEQSQREQQEQIAALYRQAEEAAPALAQERAERQRLEEQLAEQQQRVDLLQAELSPLQNAYAGKEAALEEQQQTIEDLSSRLDVATDRLATEEEYRSDLVRQLELLREEADRLRAEQAELRAAARSAEQSLVERQQEVSSLSRELASVSAKRASEQSGHQALALQHADLQEEATQLRAELTPLRAAAARLNVLEKANAELSGLVSSGDDVIRELRSQITRTEDYADGLRIKLQQRQHETDALLASREDAAASLAEAIGRINDLAGRLEAEQQLSARLARQKDEAERRLEAEVSKIRSELDAAQERVAENETVNAQLASDLLDSTATRRALESRLAEADETRDRDIRDLSKQVSQFSQQIDDYERKIGTKDAAINALLTELAHKPETPEDSAAADDVVHRLADRRPLAPDDRAGQPEKDRVTRLLIGNIDGQELRFPLFKDKLTIGRTVHNDIQLKAQYVSRRHAVVVTEDDHTRIVDWGSKNGIYVNGKRVSEQMLRNGDRVSVGTAEFKFEERPKR